MHITHEFVCDRLRACATKYGLIRRVPMTRGREAVLDSEGDQKGRIHDNERGTRVVNQIRLIERRVEQKRRNKARLCRPGGGRVALAFFADERGRRGRSGSAAVLADSWRSRRILMLARGVLGVSWVTPDCAEHSGVRPKRQRQHDGENSCPNHESLSKIEGKSRASRVEHQQWSFLGVLPGARVESITRLRNSANGGRKSRTSSWRRQQA